jgi:hypothetical protein
VYFVTNFLPTKTVSKGSATFITEILEKVLKVIIRLKNLKDECGFVKKEKERTNAYGST